MPTDDMQTIRDIAARHGFDLTPTDPRDREIAEWKDRCLAAEQVMRENAASARTAVREAAALRKEIRGRDQRDWEQGQREERLMEALPNRRFAGGTTLQEMLLTSLRWLREARPELWRDTP